MKNLELNDKALDEDRKTVIHKRYFKLNQILSENI